MFTKLAKLRYKERNSLLYKSKVEYAQWCVNHVENCAHGCKFPCYAMMMAKRFGKIKDYKDWLRPILIKNSIELLDKELPKYKDKIDFVHLCFTTDPFMVGYPEIRTMTLKIVQKLNEHGVKATILTKGIYPKKLIKTKKYGLDNEYGITLVSLDKKFKKKMEPGSAPYNERVSSLKYLHNKGLKTWVSMEPYPTPNLVSQKLSSILEKISFTDKIIFGKLNYNIEVTNFKENKNFYEEKAKEVIAFCNKNNIKYHIKYGTQKRGNKKTERIFKGEKRNLILLSK